MELELSRRGGRAAQIKIGASSWVQISQVLSLSLSLPSLVFVCFYILYSITCSLRLVQPLSMGREAVVIEPSSFTLIIWYMCNGFRFFWIHPCIILGGGWLVQSSGSLKPSPFGPDSPAVASHNIKYCTPTNSHSLFSGFELINGIEKVECLVLVYFLLDPAKAFSILNKRLWINSASWWFTLIMATGCSSGRGMWEGDHLTKGNSTWRIGWWWTLHVLPISTFLGTYTYTSAVTGGF